MNDGTVFYLAETISFFTLYFKDEYTYVNKIEEMIGYFKGGVDFNRYYYNKSLMYSNDWKESHERDRTIFIGTYNETFTCDISPDNLFVTDEEGNEYKAETIKIINKPDYIIVNNNLLSGKFKEPIIRTIDFEYTVESQSENIYRTSIYIIPVNIVFNTCTNSDPNTYNFLFFLKTPLKHDFISVNFPLEAENIVFKENYYDSCNVFVSNGKSWKNYMYPFIINYTKNYIKGDLIININAIQFIDPLINQEFIISDCNYTIKHKIDFNVYKNYEIDYKILSEFDEVLELYTGSTWDSIGLNLHNCSSCYYSENLINCRHCNYCSELIEETRHFNNTPCEELLDKLCYNTDNIKFGDHYLLYPNYYPFPDTIFKGLNNWNDGVLTGIAENSFSKKVTLILDDTKRDITIDVNI